MGQLFQETVGEIVTITETLRQNDTRCLFPDNSVMLYSKLGWLPMDNIIRTRKLSLLHKICNGYGPEYISTYVNYVKSSHDYNSRTSRRNDLITPKCKKNSLRPQNIPFQCHSSVQQNWTIVRDTLSQKRFLRDLQRKTTLEYSVTEVYLLIIF